MKLCCFISGVNMLLSAFLFYHLFPGNLFAGFTTYSPHARKVLSSTPSGKQIAIDKSRTFNLEYAVQHKQKTKDGYNRTVPTQNNFKASNIKSWKQKSSPSLQDAQRISKLKSVRQNNVSNLSFRQIDMQLRDAIRIHHETNFIQPENETCTKRFPICILVGVYKCGTREIVDFLRLHPHIEIYPSSAMNNYEMPYFQTMYKKGDAWLQSQMPCTYSNQITLMKNAGYFFDSAVPKRIQHFNESIKLILMVREPVSRSVSNYIMRENRKIKFPNSSRAMQYIESFSSIVLNSSNDVKENHRFVSHSVYDKPMKLWLQYFNLSQFLILDNEELKRDPVSVLNKVERFLGLEHIITDKMFVWNNDKGYYCVQSNITDTGMACYSEIRGHKKQISVSEETLSKLHDYFKSKNKRFFEIIGRSFDWK